MIKVSQQFSELLDWYGHLLTDHQKNILENYYNFDLSLAEIATNNNVSRSAVYDTIKRSEEILLHFENNLKLNENFKKRNKLYLRLKELNISEVNKIVEALEVIEEG